jgi:ribosomal-protein-alanine N-acetyltransferase
MNNEKKYCNSCGRELNVKNGILYEDVLSVEKEWGYFSKKDRMLHSFRICEACYDQWVKGFQIPPQESVKTEVM